MPYDLAGSAVEFVQSAAIPYPESSFPIFDREVYVVPADASRVRWIMGISSGLTRNRIKPLKSSAGCQPENSGVIFNDTVDRSGDTIRNLGVDGVVFKEPLNNAEL
jgi:hypothetical protein